MAFNPFHTFRKYRAFWISGLILVSMLSFIVCSGVGANEWMQSLISQFFGSGGQVVAEVNGRRVTFKDLKALETQRRIANDFMRSATEICIQVLNAQIEHAQKAMRAAKKKETAQKEQATIQQLTGFRQLLQEKLKKPNYFGTGTKLKDLLDFLLWRDEAKRLGVDLTMESVKDEISRLVMGPLTQWNPRASLEAARRVQELQSNYRITTEQIAEALEQEFRVQIAKMALAQARTEAILGDMTQREMTQAQKMQAAIQRVMLATAPPKIRYPMSPEQLWQSYQNHLTRYDIALLPVSVDKLAAKVPDPDETEEIQLETLFQKYKTTRYNPTSDIPGFVQPEKIKVQYVTANPHSKYYQQQARIVTTLETVPPVWPDAGMPGLGTALRVAGGQPLWNSSMEYNFNNDKKLAAQNDQKFAPGRVIYEDGLPAWWTDFAPREPEYMANVLPFSQRFLAPQLTDPDFALEISLTEWKLDPVDIAALVGSGSLPGLYSFGPANFQAAALLKRQESLKPVIAKATKERALFAGGLVLSGTNPLPSFNALAEWDEAYRKIQYLPFTVFEEPYREAREAFLSADFVKTEMEKVRERLTEKEARAFGRELETRLNNLKKEYPGLEIYETKKLYSEYTIDKAPELQAFREVFDNPKLLEMFNLIEGRKGTNRILKADEFKRLFFDQSEPQLSVAALPDYVVQQWPPEASTPNARPLFENPEQLKATGVVGKATGGMKIDMWRLPHAEQYVLFWKTETQRPEPPEKLADVRKEVLHAWKVQKVREQLVREAGGQENKVPRLKNLAEKLLEEERAGRSVLAKLRDEAKKLGVEPIILDNVSQWVPIPRQIGIDYGKWQLPKDKLVYPRDDATEQILSLTDLKEALRTIDPAAKEKKEGDDRDLDAINKALFKQFKDLAKKGTLGKNPRPIQILVNQPRSVYYVAVVVGENPPDMKDFNNAYIAAPGMGQRGDQFVTVAEQQAAEQYLEELTQQLRSNLGLKNTEGFE